MAAFTSVIDGDWSSLLTWGSASLPGNGDTVTLDNVVTISGDTIIGTSPSDQTTYVVSIGTAGQLKVASGGTLHCRGNIYNNAGSSGVGILVQGGGILELDASQNATRVYIINSDQFPAPVINLIGSAGNLATLQSNAAGANGFLNSTWGRDLTTMSYAHLLRMGNGTTPATSTSALHSITLSYTNSTIESCGQVQVAGASGQTNLIQSCDFLTTADNGGVALELTSYATGTYTLDSCVFDSVSACTILSATNLTNTNNYFGVSLISEAGIPLLAENNFFAIPGVNGPDVSGGSRMIFFISSTSDSTETFNGYLFGGVDGQVFDTLIADQNCSLVGTSNQSFSFTNTNSSQTVTLKHALRLPDYTGLGGASFVNVGWAGNIASGSKLVLDHCTYISTSGGRAGAFCSDTVLPTNSLAITNSIMWSPNPSDLGYLMVVVANNEGTQDIAYAQNCDYLRMFNAGGPLGGNPVGIDADFAVFSGSHGTFNAHPQGTTDPQFIDTTRNTATYDSAASGLNHSQTPWSAGTYTVGQQVSNQVSTYYNNAVINYRALGTTTTEPGSTTDLAWRSHWEFSTLYQLRQDVTKISSLIDWIMAGFAVQDATLNNAGSDGQTIGAGAYVQSGPTPGTVTVSNQTDSSVTLQATAGSGGVGALSYSWRYNTTNSNTIAGSTLIVGQTGLGPFVQSQAEGTTLYYFCVVTDTTPSSTASAAVAGTTYMALRTWTGTTDGVLSKASNWGGFAPTGADTAEIPSGASNYPNSGIYPAATGEITIDSGGHIDGGTIPATAGLLTNNGDITAGLIECAIDNAAGTIEYAECTGTVDNSSSILDGIFKGLVTLEAAGTIAGGTFSGGLKIANISGAIVTGLIYDANGVKIGGGSGGGNAMLFF